MQAIRLMHISCIYLVYLKGISKNASDTRTLWKGRYGVQFISLVRCMKYTLHFKTRLGVKSKYGSRILSDVKYYPGFSLQLTPSWHSEVKTCLLAALLVWKSGHITIDLIAFVSHSKDKMARLTRGGLSCEMAKKCKKCRSSETFLKHPFDVSIS